MAAAAALTRGGEDKSRRPRDILLYIPNIIGYVRLILFFISIYLIINKCFFGILIYSLAAYLDSWDGYYARKYNQTTLFGSVFDMVLDRTSTIGLQIAILTFYPSLALPFVFLITLDIMSHWYSTSLGFIIKSSHKELAYGSRLMEIYYSNKNVLFVLCLMNEMTYISLAAYNITTNAILKKFSIVFLVFSFPLMVIKNVINVMQLVASVRVFMEKVDSKRD
ncbi:MAG: MCM DNA helicase complex subunit [Marteilia pararefringens]